MSKNYLYQSQRERLSITSPTKRAKIPLDLGESKENDLHHRSQVVRHKAIVDENPEITEADLAYNENTYRSLDRDEDDPSASPTITSIPSGPTPVPNIIQLQQQDVHDIRIGYGHEATEMKPEENDEPSPVNAHRQIPMTATAASTKQLQPATTTHLDPNELGDYLKWKLPTTTDELHKYKDYITSLIQSSCMLSLQELLLCVAWLMRKGRFHANLQQVESVMQRYNTDLREYEEFMHTDPAAAYTRNLVATDDKNWTLLIICWNPKSESYIHNHPECECYVRSLTGGLVEYRYHHPNANSTIVQDEPYHHDDEEKDMSIDQCEEKHRQKKQEQQSKLVCYQRTEIPNGGVTFMNDSLGLHKIANESNALASTLHLYFPPYKSCKIYINEDSVATISNICYYTMHGKKTEYDL